MEIVMLGDSMVDVFDKLKRTRLWAESHKQEILKLLTETEDVFENAKLDQGKGVEGSKKTDPTTPFLAEQVTLLKDLTNKLSALEEKNRSHRLSKDPFDHKDARQKKKIPILLCYLLKYGIDLGHDEVGDKISSMAGELQDFASSLYKEGRKKIMCLVDGDELGKEVNVIGREREKKEIIDRLMLHQNKEAKSVSSAVVPLVTITGIRGIGKTKLADYVCSDKEVKDHFGLPIRVNGADEDFNVESVAKRVSESSAGSSKKRYLLVLDDVKIELRDECFDFTMLLQKLSERDLNIGAILVTTRSSLAADTSASTVMPYALQLQGLNEEETWSLFLQILTDSRNIIQDIGRKIVGKCRGVPLAIVTLARLLNERGSIIAEAQVAESELKEELLQKLALIYCDDLVILRKQCFAYCSLFPEDYLIDTDRLIHLWMAEGFLSPSVPSDDSSSHSLEEVGRDYVNDFLRRSIFQDVKEDEFGVVRSCRMNTLMRDLAIVKAMDENIMVDLDEQKVQDGVLRASFNFSFDVSRRIPNSLFEKARDLRTILLPVKSQSMLPHEMMMRSLACDEMFRSFKGLRMLDLPGLGIRTLPSSIQELKKLRHLDLSENNIEKLPDSITKLVYLETLKLSKCYVLKELPKDLKDLSGLRHLDIQGCLNLNHMPPGLKKLTSLQTLSLFVASNKYDIGGLGELTGLNNLTGHLEILHLERLNRPLSEANHANLKEKQHLQHLTFRWDHHDDRGSHRNDEESLQFLEPHPKLKVLYVVGYKGQQISQWLSSLQFLVKFSLYNCPQCQSLPSLDQLRCLKILELRKLQSLAFISGESDNIHETEEPSSSTSSTLFSSLKELKISDCPNLKSWWAAKPENNIPFFTCISKLQVQYCPNLACMPLYPSLDKELVLVDSSVNTLWDTIDNGGSSEPLLPFSKLKSMLITNIEEHSQPQNWLKHFISLENLHIRDCPQLKFLPQGFKHLNSLQYLTIENCPKLDLEASGTEWKYLENLRSLTIRGIPNLKFLPSEVTKCSSLEDLEFYHCPELTSLPESIGSLTSLGRLVMSECNRLASLPKQLWYLKSLHTLIIIDCPLLSPRCQRETGNDWPQIAHIKNIQVKQTSRDL